MARSDVTPCEYLRSMSSEPSTRARWESTLRDWAKPMNEHQEERAQRTADEIRSALDNYELLPNSTFQTFPQGSKRNNTDVPGDSDVDIGVVALEDITDRRSAALASFSVGRTARVKTASNVELGLAPESGRTFRTAQFKNAVHAALADHFGAANVSRGAKCVKVRSSRLTLPADVVPCFPYRLYDGPDAYQEGVRIFPDSGSSIVNFPEQHYRNGVVKNTANSRRFKRMVRCLKRMENELLERELIAEAVPSFLMECLLYRVPTNLFDGEDYADTFVQSVQSAWYYTYDPDRCAGWREINDLKPLFKADGGVFDREQSADLLWEAYRLVEGK